MIMAPRGPQRPSDIAVDLDVSAVTVSRICQRLVLKGLADRYQHQVDRRAVWCALTPGGREIVDKVMSRRRELITDVLQKLTRDERIELARSFDNFVKAAGEPLELVWEDQTPL